MAKREEVKKFEIAPRRNYTVEELKKFDNLTQKFRDDRGILNWEELAVAYGAMVKRPGNGRGFYYLAAAKRPEDRISRFDQFTNLMDQYDWWRRSGEARKEAAIQHQLAEWEKSANIVETNDIPLF